MSAKNNPLDCLDLYKDAEFYDAEFAARDFEIPFYLKHAREAAAPMLEIACGTGRLTLPIARADIDVTGLDVSRPMLERARRKSAAEGLQIEWFEQDCREIWLPRTYDLIFSATNAMQHLLDLDSACSFLRSARRALAPGGRLILDVFNPNPAKLARDSSTRYTHKIISMPSGTDIRVEAASRYRPDVQVLSFELSYFENERLLRTKRVNMRCFFPEELLALCKFNGWDVAKRFGNYDESAFGASSPKQILICQ